MPFLAIPHSAVFRPVPTPPIRDLTQPLPQKTRRIFIYATISNQVFECEPARTKTSRRIDFDEAPGAPAEAEAAGGAGAGCSLPSPAKKVKKDEGLVCECVECYTFIRHMDFGNEGCPNAERTAQTEQILADPSAPDVDESHVGYGVEKFLEETEYQEREAAEGVLAIAGRRYTMDHIRHAPTYQAEKEANKAAMTTHLHKIYRLAMMVQQERRARGVDEDEDEVCYNCADGCGSEREKLLERCIHNEWHHVRALHILPEYVASPAEFGEDDDEDDDGAAGAAGAPAADASTVSSIHGSADDADADAEDHPFAQPRSPLVDLTDASDANLSYEGALDLRPDDGDAAATATYPLRRDTEMPRLGDVARAAEAAEEGAAAAVAGAGASAAAGGAGAAAATATAFALVRPERFTRKAIERPHRLDDDLVAMMAESCLKGRIDAATAPEEAITAAFRVIDHQEELEYAELRAGPERFRDALLRMSDQTRAYNALKMRNFNAMVDRLLRIYVLCRIREADAAAFAAAERARLEAKPDANGRTRFFIHMGIADGMYEAMINNEWAAFDNMSLLPEHNTHRSA